MSIAKGLSPAILFFFVHYSDLQKSKALYFPIFTEIKGFSAADFSMLTSEELPAHKNGVKWQFDIVIL